MDKNIITREYREGDEISIMKLRELVLTGSKDMDWWVWQHRQNPAGEAIITIAETEDVKNGYRIIGHQASLPLRVKINNDIRYIFTTVDTMNHPGYRGLGIYSELRRMRLEIAKQRNYLFAYSFPNLDMRPINRKQQAKLISKKTPMWIKILKVSNISTKYLSNMGIFTDLVKVVGGGLIRIADRLTNRQIHTEVREIEKIDDRFDILWQQASSHHKIMLVRDRVYLEWRYIKKPDANYTVYVSEDGDRLLGYIVLRIVENNGLTVGWIVDILTESNDTKASRDLITKAVQYFKAIGADMVMCVMPPKAYLAPSLRKHGFLLVSKWRRSEFQITSALLIEKYPESLIYNLNNWYLTRGDSDLI